jgi:glycosyltransferase involved in cell wall biosynthesis
MPLFLKLPMLVSVVIPTRNRPRAIESCLAALAAQTLPPGSFEVFVVDDGSEPPLALDPARWPKNFDLKLLRQQNTGPAGARDHGVAKARGEFLAFTDDDCLPSPTWLQELVSALRDHPAALVGGSTFNGLKNDILAETSQFILEMVYEYFNSDSKNAYFFASNNIAVMRDNYISSGGFDAEFDLPAAEDREFCDRWRMLHRPLIWNQSAIVEHRHAQNIFEFLRLYFNYGQGAYLYKAKRKARGSGTMAEDMSFHRRLPMLAFQKTSRYALLPRLKILSSLVLWHLANASGFAFASFRCFKKTYQNHR